MQNFIVSFVASFFLISFFACGEGSNLETVENTDDNGQLIEKYTRTKDTFAKQGKYEAFFEDGQLREVAYFQNDSLDGERKLFREDGSVEIIENYKNGSFSGAYQQLFPNGKVSFEGKYTDNLMSGLWKGYYESGKLKEEVMMANNDENGIFKEYHENGNIATKGTYKDGPFEEGTLEEYNETGELIIKKHCHLGFCKEIWSKEKGDTEIDLEEFTQFAKKMRAIE